ncbi:hypothetical protein [Algibacter lectus]|uniref:hypothetical protein n=1 Tax=Algibacter lectus TaxID=221126 RepID=UPI001EE6B9AE|nr:hypothetical protein [Algibacter lectus]
MKKEIKKIVSYSSFLALILMSVLACSSSEDSSSEEADSDDGEEAVTELHAAFAAFNSDAVTAILSDDGTEVYIETTGIQTILQCIGKQIMRFTSMSQMFQKQLRILI